MSLWSDVSTGIDRFIAWTSRDRVLDSAAKVALRAIPMVGSALADFYEEATSKDEGEEVTDLLYEILARVEQIGPAGVEDVRGLFESPVPKQVDAREWMAATSTSLERLKGQLDSVHDQMSSMAGTLDRMEEELTSLTWGAMDFMDGDPGDAVRLLVLLGGLLTQSEQIFSEQLRIAGLIESEVDTRGKPEEFKGRDDVLMWASRRGLIPDGEPTFQFRALREVTDRLYGVNLRVRSLIRANREALSFFDVSLLELHLSTWLAKYEYMRQYDDEHMCWVFVGVAPTAIGFPSEVDEAVRSQLEKALSVARLEHVAIDRA